MSKGSNKHKPLSTEASEQDVDAAGNKPIDTAADKTVSGLDQGSRPSQGSAQPQTCCSNCQTVFEVSPELLASNDTRVRCGECLSIFDALINLRRDELLDADDDFLVDEDGNIFDADSSYERAMSGASDDFTASGDYSAAVGVEDVRAVPAGSSDDESVLDVTYSDFDLFSGEAGLPEVAYFDQTQDMERLHFDEPDGDETFSDTLFAHDMTVASPEHSNSGPGEQSPALEPGALNAKVGFVTDDIQRDPVVFTYRDPDSPQTEPSAIERRHDQVLSEPDHRDESVAPAARSASNPWIMRTLLAVLIVVMTIGLYGYRNRDALLQDPDMRPWLAKACTWFGCEMTPMVSLAALKVLKRMVFSHPTVENALVIDLAFVNQATFSQPYPMLEIRLTNRNGGLVVQNNVAPAEYLDAWQAGDLLSAGERLDLSLTVEDPGQTATSFELKFR